MPQPRGEMATGELPSWIRLQGRTNARLFLLARDVEAEFVAPAARDAFAAVQGRTGGCAWVLRVVIEDAGAEHAGAGRYSLEIELQHYANRATVRFSGNGLEPPAIDPARVRAEIEANCAAFVRRR